jgi:hypothetical protein
MREKKSKTNETKITEKQNKEERKIRVINGDRKEEIEAIEMPIHSQHLNPEGDIILI